MNMTKIVLGSTAAGALGCLFIPAAAQIAGGMAAVAGTCFIGSVVLLPAALIVGFGISCLLSLPALFRLGPPDWLVLMVETLYFLALMAAVAFVGSAIVGLSLMPVLNAALIGAAVMIGVNILWYSLCAALTYHESVGDHFFLKQADLKIKPPLGEDPIKFDTHNYPIPEQWSLSGA